MVLVLPFACTTISMAFTNALSLRDSLALSFGTRADVCCLWDRDANMPSPELRACSVTAATFLHHLNLTPRHLAWAL